MTSNPPILVLAPASDMSLRRVFDPPILGLGLRQRLELGAAAAGFSRVIALSPEAAGWREIGARVEAGERVTLVIVPAIGLGETQWLKRLAATAAAARGWAAGEHVILLPRMTHDALAVLGGGDAPQSFATLRARLARHFGDPAPLPQALEPWLVSAPGDIPAAERRLLRSLVKETEGVMSRHVERPISLGISRRLAATEITPNQMTLLSLAVGLLGAPCFLSPRASLQTLGAILLLAHSVLDGCDGELARLKFQESRWGGILDFWADNVVHCAAFAGMALGWSRLVGTTLPFWLGAAAILGTLGSAGFVYLRMIRPKEGGGPAFTSVASAPGRPLARLLDALSRRDFLYLILVFAVFGEVRWFLPLAAAGAPLFFFLLLVLAWREGAAGMSHA